MAVRRDLSGTVVGFREIRRRGRQALNRPPHPRPHSCHAAPPPPVPTGKGTPGDRNIPQGKGKHSRVSRKPGGTYEAYSRLFSRPGRKGSRPAVYFTPREAAKVPAPLPPSPTASWLTTHRLSLAKHRDPVQLCEPNQAEPEGVRGCSAAPSPGENVQLSVTALVQKKS